MAGGIVLGVDASCVHVGQLAQVLNGDRAVGDQLRSKTLRAEKELEKPNHPFIGQTHLSLSVLCALGQARGRH